jgi:hypothetical protein
VAFCAGDHLAALQPSAVLTIMPSYWFAASPSKQDRSRISLNFGLARADRLLRERVVPGLGRVWFVRQLSWPVAALAVREELKALTNVPRASAISHGLEALGCKLEWANDPEVGRILGEAGVQPQSRGGHLGLRQASDHEALRAEHTSPGRDHQAPRCLAATHAGLGIEAGMNRDRRGEPSRATAGSPLHAAPIPVGKRTLTQSLLESAPHPGRL